ncbi:hypothetical protein [Kushneria avicenniae]|uniref:hypothetical protein n=1 Tax=Kushneria avicenniae TaxID=402385 RepID=UPI00158748D5|nr:hypothetical protein [Kushneria avicenniae]
MEDMEFPSLGRIFYVPTPDMTGTNTAQAVLEIASGNRQTLSDGFSKGRISQRK